jgi:hypothetical protein
MVWYLSAGDDFAATGASPVSVFQQPLPAADPQRRAAFQPIGCGETEVGERLFGHWSDHHRGISAAFASLLFAPFPQKSTVCSTTYLTSNASFRSQAVNMFDNSAKDKNVSLKVEGPQRSAPNVMGDPTRLQQVRPGVGGGVAAMLGNVRDRVAWFLNVGRDNHLQIVANLVSNALKFTPRGGEVCVSFEHLWGDGTSPEGAQGTLFTLKLFRS